MTTVTPTDQPSVKGIRQGSTEEHTMSSHLHAQFIRTRQAAAAATAGLILASAGVACASAADHTAASVTPTSPPALHVGATSRGYVTRMHELEARGYVEIACTRTGALMFNRSTHRTVNVSAQASTPRRDAQMAN
jgi:hypothetical protein